MTVVIIGTLAILSLRLFIQNEHLKPLDGVVGGILNAVWIIFMNTIWQKVAVALNNWGTLQSDTFITYVL
jgi:hypothetical protein